LFHKRRSYADSDRCELQVKPLIGESTTVVSTQNGIPWWDHHVERVDRGGVIRHTEGNRISLGQPDGSRSDRVRAIAEVLVKSGLRCPVTRATLVQMVRDPGVCTLVRDIMSEVEAVANKLGIELPVSIDQGIAGAEKVGEHKTSMLQDLEARRPMEVEAVVGAVVELGERLRLHRTSRYHGKKEIRN
jgi:2-dehydropantoate 2-reductase